MIQDAQSKKESKLITVPRGNPLVAELSSHGDRVSYTVTKSGEYGDGFVISTMGGAPQKVCRDCVLRSWSDATDSGLLLTRVQPEPGTYWSDLTSRQERKIFDQGTAARAFPDGKFWCAYQPQVDKSSEPRVYIVPIFPDRVSTTQDVIPVTTGKANDYLNYLNAASPDGETIFFVSSRDGFHCVWAQKVNKQSMHPEGAAFPVYHQHSSRQSTVYVITGYRRLAAARNKLVFPSAERTGNIWMAELPHSGAN